MRVLAVDGDIIAYKTAAVCEDHFEGACEAIVDSTLREIATDTGISAMRIYLSGERNFRYDVAVTKPYKGNRATMVRPQYLETTKQYMADKYGAVRVDGYEADDAIATDMTVNGAVHCGIDKDILQVAGEHYNYIKKEWTTITPDDAELILYRQILMGDNSDNVPGLPRVGEKKAADAITCVETAMMDAMDLYKYICFDKMPDVDPMTYFIEQSALITMVKDVKLHCIDFGTFTVVDGRDEGFEAQEGQSLQSILNKRNLKL